MRDCSGRRFLGEGVVGGGHMNGALASWTAVRIVLVAVGVCMLVHAPLHAELVVTGEEFESFLDSGRTGRMVYVKAEDEKAYFVDFSNEEISEKLLCDTSGVREPLISPDGGYVAFATGRWDKHNCEGSSGTVWICRLEPNTDPVAVAEGFDPHWWSDESGTYIVYRTTSCKCTYPCPGTTNRLKIDLESLQAEGEPEILVNSGFGGGLSRDGRWLCTAYHTVCMYDLREETSYVLIDEKQACNPSITPSSDTSRQNRMMHLNLGITAGDQSFSSHETFGIRDNNDSLLWYITNPEGSGEWQHPEWSTHEHFATCCAGYGGNLTYNDCDYWDVYAINIPSKATLRITEGGDYDVPHLWVGKSGPDTKAAPRGPGFSGGDGRYDGGRWAGSKVTVFRGRDGTIRLTSSEGPVPALTVSTPEGVTLMRIEPGGTGTLRTAARLPGGVYVLAGTTRTGSFSRAVVVP